MKLSCSYGARPYWVLGVLLALPLVDFGRPLSANWTGMPPVSSTLSLAVDVTERSAKFSIRSQPLPRALQRFARQAGLSLSRPNMANVTHVTAGVYGRRRIDAALAQLLEGSGYDFEFTSEGQIVIKRSPSPTHSMEPQLNLGQYRPPIQEILVTATRRASLASQLPLAASVVQLSDTEGLGQITTDQISRRIPGLYAHYQRPGQNKIVVRGLSDGIFTGQIQSLVAVYQDYSRLSYSAPLPVGRLLDVDRVEILRGPQGTLYGSGSLTGLYRIVTNQPDLLDASLSASTTGAYTEHGDPSYDIASVINLPLLKNKLAIRGAGLFSREGGYIDERLRGENNVNDSEEILGRIIALFSPWTWAKLTLSAQHRALDVDDSNYSTDGNGQYGRNNIISEPLRDRFTQTKARLDIDMDFAELVTSTSWSDRARQHAEDASRGNPRLVGIPISPGIFLTSDDIETVTVEMHVASKTDGLIDWLVGGFYSERDTVSFNHLIIPGAPEDQVFNRLNTGFVTRTQQALLKLIPNDSPIPTDIEAIRDGGAFFSDSIEDLREIAAFTEVTLHLTDQVSITGGLRWFRNRANFTYRISELLTEDLFGSFAQPRIEEDWIPKAQIAYSPSGERLIYAQYSRGYRLGGNNSINPAPYVDLRFQRLPPIQFRTALPFNSDRLDNYELGAKGQFFDHQLNVNMAIYYSDWNDFQTVQFDPDGLTEVANVGSADIYGVEMDIKYNPAADTQFRFAANWNHSDIRDTDGRFRATTDESLPGVPKWSLRVEGQRSFAFKDRDYDLLVHYDYRDGAGLLFDGLSNPQLKASHLLGLRLTTKFGAMTASLFADNLLASNGNQFGYTNSFNLIVTDGRISSPQNTPRRPRTYGLSLSLQY